LQLAEKERMLEDAMTNDEEVFLLPPKKEEYLFQF